MHSFRTVLCLVALLAAVALSSPTPTIQKRSFTHRVRRSINRMDPNAGPNAMFKAYRKFGFDMADRQFQPQAQGMDQPDDQSGDLLGELIGDDQGDQTDEQPQGQSQGQPQGQPQGQAQGQPQGQSSGQSQTQPQTQPQGNGSSGAQSGTVGATPQNNNAEYLEQVNVGGQMMTMDFDTGSSDLWVFSTSLSKQAIGQHSAFDPTKSQTFQPLQGSTWQISYGDGSGAAGTVGKDAVNIGGATATSQAVELATAVSQSFMMDTQNDGLVGLAFSKLNTVKPQQQKTFFDTIMPQLAMPVFSVDLRNDNTGTYQFGGIDKTKFTGQLTAAPVDSSQGFWQVSSPTFTVGNQKIANQGGSPAIADTGTSLLLVDPMVAQTYYSKVQGAQNNSQAGGFTVPCNAQLPDFGVAIGNNYTAMVPGKNIMFAQVDAQNCFGGIQSNGGSQMQIYGDVMFRSQYVVFDGKNMQLMVAPKSGA